MTLALESLVVSWCLKILSVVITVIIYGRMIEIYLYTSLAPIPFATMSNREWGHVGTNYFRGLFALAFQAFLMMVCVAIYAALIGSIRVSSDIHSALFGTIVCMGFAAGIGVPFYFLMRDTLGTSNATAGMVLLMLPEFFFALYEKNGMHLETILTNFISVRFKRPAVRCYEVENLYERELETAAPIQKKGGILGKK